MRVQASAYQELETVTRREPIFGVAVSAERRRIYRVRIGLDGKFFTSQQKYTTFEAAQRAAKRLQKKLEATR